MLSAVTRSVIKSNVTGIALFLSYRKQETYNNQRKRGRLTKAAAGEISQDTRQAPRNPFPPPSNCLSVLSQVLHAHAPACVRAELGAKFRASRQLRMEILSYHAIITLTLLGEWAASCNSLSFLIWRIYCHVLLLLLLSLLSTAC